MQHLKASKIVRGLVATVVAAVLALLASEVFLQLTVSPVIEESLWYTGDIHTRDDKYGFVFTPNYHGWMRHADKVFLEELTLDPHGFRRPARRADSRQDVLLLGGYSMAFSYGLSDDTALPRAVGDALATPSSVYSAAWPGFDTFRTFHLYRDFLESEVKPRFTVVFFYEESLADFASIPDSFDEFTDSTDEARDAFRYFEHRAVAPPAGRSQLLLGKWYYRSMVAHKFGDELDLLDNHLSAVLRKLHLQQPIPEAAPRESAAGAERGADRYRAWTAYLTRYFGGSDRVLFVFLPRLAQDPTPDRYDPAIALLPAGAHYLDLNRSLGDRLPPDSGFLAWGHYSADSARQIGRLVAREIDAIQSAAIGPRAAE